MSSVSTRNLRITSLCAAAALTASAAATTYVIDLQGDNISGQDFTLLGAPGNDIAVIIDAMDVDALEANMSGPESGEWAMSVWFLGPRADASGADCSHAFVEGSSNNSDFVGTNFCGSVITGTFSNGDFEDADFRCGADLSSYTPFAPTDFAGAMYDNSTIFGDNSALADHMTLVPDPDCPGDASGDLIVDINDLNLVLGNFGTVGPTGDVNDSGTVDIEDLNLVIGNFGSSCAP